MFKLRFFIIVFFIILNKSVLAAQSELLNKSRMDINNEFCHQIMNLCNKLKEILQQDKEISNVDNEFYFKNGNTWENQKDRLNQKLNFLIRKRDLAIQLKEVANEINNLKNYIFNTDLIEIYKEVLNLTQCTNLEKINHIIELIENFKSFHKEA